MRITSKGQVTIPQQIREKAGLRPGSEVEFEYVDGRVVIRPVPRRESWARAALERARGTANDDDPDWAEWSMRQLEPLISEGKGVINPIVFAEVAANSGSRVGGARARSLQAAA